MVVMTKLQYKLVNDLYLRDIKGETISIETSKYDLKETDSIMQVRELVYTIDELIIMGMVHADMPYYLESDFVSFEYMNKAVEIIDGRLKISKLGIEYIESKNQRGLKKLYNKAKKYLNGQFLDKPIKYLVTHLIAFLLGAGCMWGIMQLF